MTTIGDPNQSAGGNRSDVQVRVVGTAIEVDAPVRGEAIQLRGPARP